jgi:uncharacterized protein YkwD
MFGANRISACIFLVVAMPLGCGCQPVLQTQEGEGRTKWVESPVSALPSPTVRLSTESSSEPVGTGDLTPERDALEDAGREQTMPVVVDLVQAINLERGKMGRGPLQLRTELVDLAFNRAQELVSQNYFDHRDPTDGYLPARQGLVQAGFAGKLGEVLVAVFGPVDALAPRALQAWWTSDAHRRVLTDPDYRYIGVGLASDQVWWKVVVLLAEHSP